jgi:hypothetical protein
MRINKLDFVILHLLLRYLAERRINKYLSLVLVISVCSITYVLGLSDVLTYLDYISPL